MLLHTSGVADYDFSTPAFNQFDPALSLEEMNAGAEIVDHFATHDDVVAWAAANPNFAQGGTLSRLDLLVTVLAMQKGLISSSKDLVFTVGHPAGSKPAYTNLYTSQSKVLQRPLTTFSPLQRQEKRESLLGDGTKDNSKDGSGGGDDKDKAKKPSMLPLALGAVALFLLGRK